MMPEADGRRVTVSPARNEIFSHALCQNDTLFPQLLGSPRRSHSITSLKTFL